MRIIVQLIKFVLKELGNTRKMKLIVKIW